MREDRRQLSVAGGVHIYYYYPTTSVDPLPMPVKKHKRKLRIYIGYQTSTQPDSSLAHFISNQLGESHEVLVEPQVSVDAEFNNFDHLFEKIRNCDIFIPLLSDNSVFSEIMIHEISLASNLSRSQGKPMILVVRVAHNKPFVYPLSAYLNHVSWSFWNSTVDNSRLVKELSKAIKGDNPALTDLEAKKSTLSWGEGESDVPRPSPYAIPTWLEKVDGTMNPGSMFYVERPEDIICDLELKRGGATIIIQAARQMGKSSMLVRTLESSQKEGKLIVFLDFQLLDESKLRQPALFYKNFCHWIVKELDLPDSVEAYWNAKAWLGDVQLCTDYIHENVLKLLDHPIVLAIDEADRLLSCEFRTDFFGMLRAWHNRRRPGNEWQRLDLLLVISTEPYALVRSLEQSPFNVGQVIRPKDFSLDQIADLNERHHFVFSDSQLEDVMLLLGGHPYLTRLAMYLVVRGDYLASDLLTNAAQEQGPFGDHLRHMARLVSRSRLDSAMTQVITAKSCPDNESFIRLHQAGLVRRDDIFVVPRCGLYMTYFREKQLVK